MHALGEKKYSYKRATLYPEHVIRITKVFLGEIYLDRLVGTIPLIPNGVQVTAFTQYIKKPQHHRSVFSVCVLCDPPHPQQRDCLFAGAGLWHSRGVIYVDFPLLHPLSSEQRKGDPSLPGPHCSSTTQPVLTASQWKAWLLSCRVLCFQLWISVFLLSLLNAVWILCESAFFLFLFSFLPLSIV